MKIFRSILKWFLVAILGFIALVCIGNFIYSEFFYEREMNQIKEKLNQIKQVEVLDIWGHQDLTLEEVTARLKVQNKGEIVLYGLSKDAFDYPESIPIVEIGGYSFTQFYCHGGMSFNLNIGTKSNLYALFNQELKDVQEVIENYDYILDQVKTLKKSPEINYFENNGQEFYLLVHTEKSKDQDPIFNLVGVENLVDYAKTLKWKNPNCF